MSDIATKRDRRFLMQVVGGIFICLLVYLLTAYDSEGPSFIIPVDQLIDN